MKALKNLFLLFILIIIFFGAYVFHPLILERMAGYLVVQDRLDVADAILVLGGDDNGERMAEGVRLYKQEYAKYILISGGPLNWKLTYAGWMKKQAVESGVPESQILLQKRSRSTIDDAIFTLPVVREHRFRTVILVTSPHHTRRASRVFRKIFSPEGITIIVRPAQESDFNPNRWWTRHEDTAKVVWEYVTLVLYFFKGY